MSSHGGKKFGDLVGSIDEGTSSARFILFRAETSEVVCFHQKELRQIYPQEGWVEQDPKEILSVVEECIERTVDKLCELGGRPEDIVAVGVTNQRETTIVWDKTTGEPLYNAIVWLDMRTASTVDQLLETVPNKTRNKNYLKPLCGLPLSPYFSAVKLRWLIDNVPKLMTTMTDKKSSKTRWSDGLIAVFLELWEEHISSLRGTRRNSHVHAEIAAEMSRRGEVVITAEDVRLRIHNMTQKYRTEKQKIGSSGGSPSNWKFFHQVHSILGSFPVHNASSLIEESFTDIEMLDQDNAQDEQYGSSGSESIVEGSCEMASSSGNASSGNGYDPSGDGSDEEVDPVPAPVKRKTKNSQSDIIKRLDLIQFQINEQLDYCKEQDAKILEIEKRRADLLEVYVSNTTEIKNAFIELLNRN